MIRYYFLSTILILCLTVFGQDSEKYFEKGVEKFKKGKYESAIKLFDKAISIKSDNYEYWFYKGNSNFALRLYDEALVNYNKTETLFPSFIGVYIMKGRCKERFTDYEGAIIDFSYALHIDPDYDDAHIRRGMIYEMLGKNDSACADFNNLESDKLPPFVKEKIKNCNDTIKPTKEIHPICRLTSFSDNDNYGFTQEQPIKVGNGPNGAPANERAYLDLLCDGQGKPISYYREGSCCAHESKNGFNGMAMLDIYVINYYNENGIKETAKVYISMYDYEEPLIIKGFQTVKLIKSSR